MTAGYLLFFLTLLIFGGAAVLALAWAISSGQMENLSRGAESIFDADEPIGEMTDMVLNVPLTPNPSPGGRGGSEARRLP
jgi:cbb3-type cytochrome oxidase maturation protein